DELRRNVGTGSIALGDPLGHRWAGAVAFSGELGARYPHEAANQLWQLIMQSHTVTGEVPSALGGLFARLANRSEDARDAGIVLTLLDAKLTRLARPGAKPEYATAAVRAILGVLSARHTRSGCSASFAYLCAMPQ